MMMTGSAPKKLPTKHSLASCKPLKILTLQHVRPLCSKKNLINCIINLSNKQ
jgi:hypothetical protein